MYPNVYITSGFLDHFDTCCKSISSQSILKDDPQFTSLVRIKDLFLSSNIYTDIKDKKFIKYFKGELGNPNNIADLIFKSIIKENSFSNHRKLIANQHQTDCKQNNFCFFVDDNFDVCEKQSKENGKIVLGNEFLKEPFFLNHTFPGELTDETIPQKEKIKHPCTGLVIIDKYLFTDSSNSKIRNLIDVLKTIIPAELNQPFELDIFIENPENNSIVENKYNEILDSFQGNLSLHIYAPRKIRESDRYIISNYATIMIGHPLDRKTNISVNFYPSNLSKEQIKESYSIWSSKLLIAKDLIIKTPKSYGSVKSVWTSDTIKHSIFDIH